jgi:V/A-type H+-transporting ATPase subunit C
MPPERLQMLTSAEDLNSLLEFLRGSEYFDVVTSAMADYEKYGLKAILTALDKHFYASLWGDVQARRAQRQILRALVGYEIDSLNVKLILRLRQEGAAPDEIDRLLVKPSSELKDAMLREMIAAKDTRSAVHMIHITTHGKALSEAISEIEQRGVPAAEKVIDETRLRLSKWFELTHFFSIAPVISYINQKENEMRNLRAIIVLKANGVEPSRIKEKIIKVPKIEL